MDDRSLDAYYRMMSRRPDTKLEPEETSEMTSKEVFAFMFESFRFSQGSTKIQKKMYTWFWHRYPLCTISEDVQTDAKQRLIDTTVQMTYTGKHRKVSLGEIETTADTEIKNFIYSKPESTQSLNIDDVLRDIVVGMLARDLKFSITREQAFVPDIIELSAKSNSEYFQSLLDDIRKYILDHPDVLEINK